MTLTTRLAASPIGLLAAATMPASGQGPLGIRADTVAPGYVVLSGYTNGNILAVLGENAVLLVDAQSARRVAQADSVLRTMTTQPVRWVISTHYHADHTEGNGYWRARGAELIAHERTAVEARRDTTIPELGWHRQAADPGTLPTRTFHDSLRLRLPLGDVVVRHVPSAHTNGDAIVWFPGANVVHVGDVLELGAPPFVDWWAGGTLDGTIAAVEAILARTDARTRIVPGHGPVADRADLQTYRDMLAVIRDRMVDQIQAGRTRWQLAVPAIVAGHVNRLGGERRARQFVEQLYPGVRGRAGTPAPLSAGAFIVRLGLDTLAVEQFERFADRLEGTLVRRTPRTTVHRYVVSLDADGQPIRFTDSLSSRVGSRRPGDLQAAVVEFGTDSATVILTRDTASTRRIPAAGAFPALPESFALYELWLDAARRHGDTVALVVAPLGGPAGLLRMRRAGRDSVLIPIIGGAFAARIDDAGRLLQLDGRATTLKYLVERVPDVYVERLAASFAVRDSLGRGLGTWLSGRDTVVAKVGTVHIWIDYGRPGRRGREIFTHGVLGDTLWRTGANAATQLEVSGPVAIGESVLPAGRYSLWTRFHDDGRADLIVNAQSGQWGTQYDPTRDVLRVPLQRVHLEESAELLTITLTPLGDGAILGIWWDREELRVPLRPIGPPR